MVLLDLSPNEILKIPFFQLQYAVFSAVHTYTVHTQCELFI